MIKPFRITSASNQIIKEVRSLHDKKGRVNAKAFILEGTRLVKDAVEAGAKIRYLIISDSFFEKDGYLFEQMPNIKAVQIPDELFNRIGETQSPQGIMAVAEFPVYNQCDILKRVERVIALENLQDPGNLGTIIRTADACGFDAVILSKDSVDPYNPKVIRSTMGSFFHLPVLVVEDFYETLERLKDMGVLLAAAHTRMSLPCWDAKLSKSIAIIIGNEGKGLSEKALELSNISIMIPMAGRAESLNASAAASILMYEAMRQREGTNFAKVLEKGG